MPDIPDRLSAALEDRYVIRRVLGEGGMATVYLADDLKHDRKVAIKVLKPELSAVIGADRFLAEIKTTANLQHPHILALFDSGEADGFLFYVMPYVEGESLRDRLDRQKQLPVDEAVRISAAVANALDYAHRQGVIHRDIKPANILLQDGEPVVADFGIALAVSAAGGGRLTETGLSLGTPHYMSPEQATADRELNPQSDIYALACVTYEMLTGGPPFSAPTAQAVLMQILTEDAKPVTTVRRSVPAHVEATLAKALEKLPADRFTTAEAFGRALRDPGATEALRSARVGASGRRVGGRWSQLVWPGIAAAAVVAAVLGWARQSEPERAVTRLVIPTGNESGSSSIVPRSLTISPDGRSIVYLQDDESGGLRTYRRDLDAEGPVRIFGSQISGAAFSPTSDRVVLHDGGSLRLFGPDGGSGTVLAGDVMGTSSVLWSRDGWVYYTDTEGTLLRIRPDGSASERVALADSTQLLYAFADLPDASGLITVNPIARSVGFLDLESGEWTRLGPGTDAWVADDEFLVWADDGRLLGQRLDPEAGALMGTAVDLLDGVAVTQYIGIPLVSVSRSGTLVYVATDPGQDPENLVAVTRGGVRVTRSNVIVRSDLGLTISPDGSRIVFEERPDNLGDVYMVDLASGLRTRLTFGADAVYPTWSPDGERVAYYRVVDGDYGLYWRPADGSGVEEVLLNGPGREIEVRFFPDGERILVRQGDRSTADGTDLWMYRIGEPDSGVPITSGGGNEVAPRLSPDGRYVAYATDELGPVQHVFVRSIDDPRERWQISDQGGGNEPLWNQDGTELYYRRSGVLMAVPVQTEPGFRRLAEPVELFSTVGLTGNTNHTTYGLMPDGETFLFIESPQGTATQIVINWVEELRQRLGG